MAMRLLKSLPLVMESGAYYVTAKDLVGMLAKTLDFTGGEFAQQALVCPLLTDLFRNLLSVHCLACKRTRDLVAFCYHTRRRYLAAGGGRF